jgi:predicted nucleotidyltransferase
MPNTSKVDRQPRSAAIADAAPVESIGREVVRACRAAMGSSLRAVVLTGSVARGEGSFVQAEGGWRLLGDVDVLAVAHERAAGPFSGDAISREVKRVLIEAGIRAEVGIRVIWPQYLRSVRPHIFAYELRECGRVLDGDVDVLKLIPPFRAADIPLEDGFRVLANRICEQLDALADFEKSPGTLTGEAQYLATKFYLEMTTSLLLFAGQYAPTYRARLERLERLAGEGADLPLEGRRFAERVRQCTELKLRPGEANLPFSFWQEAIANAQVLWKWEMRHLRAQQRGFTALVRSSECLGCESFAQWARGWLHLLRHAGWQRSWRLWPQWMRLCCQGSPRYLVYAAAARVYFAMETLAGDASASSHDASTASNLLPLPPQTGDGDWRAVAKAVGLNYRELLVHTRS